MHNTPKKGCNPLKYNCFNPETRTQILHKCSDPEIKQYIQELYGLIEYQMIMIDDQRREIIAFKHKEGWKHYDKS